MKIIARIVMAGLILAVLKYFDGEISSFADWNLSGVLYLLPYLIAGYDVIYEAVRGVMDGEIFDEHFLMTVATMGALILGENFEACAVMIFYQAGEFFSDYASDRTRENISALMDLRPDYANIENEDGTSQRIDPSAVTEGSVIIIKPGEKIPIDGIIIDGHSGIDASALTGESIPRNVKEGDEILSGSVNMSGVLRVRTTKTFTQSTASKILALIEDADNGKSHSEKFITRFARIYTPAVCALSLAVALIPPMFAGNFRTWIYHALTFLVVSCPCALVVSVPLAFFAAVGGAGSRKILIKGGIFVERLANLSAVIFDKTGTLTRGIFEVSSVHADSMTNDELLHIAAHAERFSSHPAGVALRKAYPNESDNCKVEDAEEIAGNGVRAKVEGSEVCAGNLSFISGVVDGDIRPCSESGTVVHVSSGGNYAGHVVISDKVKDSAKSAVEALRAEGINQIIMLTGDSEPSAKATAESIGIMEYYSGLLPADKVKRVESLAGVRAFVGDGINDAPVLAGSDVGIAMGGLGSDAAIEAADVVIMDDDLMRIPEAVRISRKCMRIVRENVIGSIGVKIACLSLGAFGLAGMNLAVFADVGVMIIAVLNSIRARFNHFA